MRYAKWIQRSLPSCLLCLWTKQPVCSAVLCAQHRVLSSPMCSAVPCAQLPRVLTLVYSAQCAQQPRVLSPVCSAAPCAQQPHVLSSELPRETGIILRCAVKVGKPLQTKQGNRPSCRDQEGGRRSKEMVPGTSVVPSSETGLILRCAGKVGTPCPLPFFLTL